MFCLGITIDLIDEVGVEHLQKLGVCLGDQIRWQQRQKVGAICKPNLDLSKNPEMYVRSSNERFRAPMGAERNAICLKSLDLAKAFRIEPYGTRTYNDLTIVERTNAAQALQLAFPHALFDKETALAQFKLFAKSRLYSENKRVKRKAMSEARGDEEAEAHDIRGAEEEEIHHGRAEEELVEVNYLPEPSSSASRPNRVRHPSSKHKDFIASGDFDL